MTNDLAKQNEKIVMRVSTNSMIVNIILSVFKVAAGFIAHSGAMISDGVHSASDVFSTIIVMVGYKMSAKDSDENHQYGHERMECVAAILLAMVLCVTGFAIGAGGVEKIFGAEASALEVPGKLALAAAVLSIVVKEGMYHYTRHAAKQVNSGALMADAWHHRSDALSSIGSMIGIAGAMLGFPILDPAASVIICLCIFKVAYDILKDALVKMLDTSCNEEYENKISDYIMAQEGVMHLDMLKTRMFGNKIYIDAEIAIDGNKLLKEAHDIAERVHDGVEKNFSNIKHIMIHVNPIFTNEKAQL